MTNLVRGVPRFSLTGFVSLEAHVRRLWRPSVWLLAMLSASVPTVTPQGVASEFEATAKFLAITPGFVEWPPETFHSASEPLQICVHGDFSFGTLLAEQTRSASLNGHRVEVKWARKEQDVSGCKLLFVSRSAAKRYDKVLDAVKNSITLTIGEDSEFLKAGGMLSIQVMPSGVQFDVNLDAVKDGHLKLSSQLLSLARHIVRRPEGTKS